ncbi:ATP-binding protein [Spirillospora sp. NPDC052269]
MTPAQLAAAFPGWSVFRSQGPDGSSAAWYATRHRRLSDRELHRGRAATLVADTGDALAELLGDDAGVPSVLPDELLFSCVEIPGQESGVPCVRRWARNLLADPHTQNLAGDAELIVSEYVTNAIWHSASGLAGGRVRVELLLTAAVLRVTVYDDGPTDTVAPDDADEHGRGLLLVAACSDDHGHRHLPDGQHLSWASVNR